MPPQLINHLFTSPLRLGFAHQPNHPSPRFGVSRMNLLLAQICSMALCGCVSVLWQYLGTDTQSLIYLRYISAPVGRTFKSQLRYHLCNTPLHLVESPDCYREGVRSRLIKKPPQYIFYRRIGIFHRLFNIHGLHPFYFGDIFFSLRYQFLF